MCELLRVPRLRRRRLGRLGASLLAAGAVFAAAPAWAGHGDSPSPELNVVGQFVVDIDEHTTDVWALGNYAYIGSFSSPICSFDITGVRVIDISDPTDPVQVAFIKDKIGTRTNDVKAASLNTSQWSGDILVTVNEGCGVTLPRLNANGSAARPRGGRGGISIWDVTDPTRPRALRQNFLSAGKSTSRGASTSNGIHNTYIWEDNGNAYLIAVDDVDTQDVIIVDITNPSNPMEITRVGAPDWPDLGFSEIEGPAVFLHDVWVQENDGYVTAYLSYWDAGLVLLDVTDPANPVFLGDSTYPNPDLSGLPPEGNGHVAVPTADGSLVIFGDEDTSPFSTFLNSTIGGTPSANKVMVALFGPQPAAVAFDALTPAPVLFVADNFGCNPGDFMDAPGGASDIALIQRGDCFFSTKAANAQAADYDGYIVYNDAAGGDGLINMSAGTADVINIPGLFLGNTVGSAMAAVIMGSGTVTVDSVAAIADGEGFMRVMDVTDPENMVQVGSFATEFTLPPDNANVAGTRDAHNVVVDGDRAYWAWYYEGIRVVEFSDCDAGDGFEGCTPTEVAHFGGGDFGPDPGDEPETNFWGVYLHTLPADGNTYILGSDRNGGLWIFDVPL